MKKALAFIAVMLLVAVTGMAQTINIHRTDGTVVSYPATEVEYIDFTVAPVDPGVPAPPAPGKAPEGVEAVDLGLPSGTKWANMNVGATTPEEAGDYFRWAETTPFEEWALPDYLESLEDSYPYLGVDLGEIAGTQYDAATANWGDPWKMPTGEQIEELAANCTYTWTTQNGVNGGKVTGPNGASIFFPASGQRSNWDGKLYSVGSSGCCWSASTYSGSTDTARDLGFGPFDWYWWESNSRTQGVPVRAVAK